MQRLVCDRSITSRNNAPISNFGGGFRWKSEYPWFIKEVKITVIINYGIKLCSVECLLISSSGRVLWLG
ncbi:Uncharacterized protein FWK35_00004022 [Aphis craccivora]|uniref:Uncharacterized protein n=1 Tax=Aphis craccivora TaxID=307492 RepID=A0A6G0YWB6_APHCR|nr:Uncharacterized protein FWK35_00004022 [Aphis craccivora]